MFDVPYNEPAGRNPHHLIHEIREETFDPFENAELFFQDLDGSLYGRAARPARSMQRSSPAPISAVPPGWASMSKATVSTRFYRPGTRCLPKAT